MILANIGCILASVVNLFISIVKYNSTIEIFIFIYNNVYKIWIVCDDLRYSFRVTLKQKIFFLLILLGLLCSM
jgi:hypothetical protein